MRSVSELSKNMNRVLVLLLFIFSGETIAAENLMRGDYDGAWISTYSAVENEKQILNIFLNAESVYERHFESSKSQILTTEKYELVDDVLLLLFNSPDNVFGYKLVLSGWKSKSYKKLYGSMFMYRNGVQFNMLPVSFEPAQ